MDCRLQIMGDILLLLTHFDDIPSLKMNTQHMSQATQTRHATSSDTEEDSLDTFSLLNDTWITDLDADDEAEASDRSKIIPEKLEQAISKAEMELKELQESYAKVKSMKSSKKKPQLSLKDRIKSSLRRKSKTGTESVMHRAVQATPDSGSQSGGPAVPSAGSVRPRRTQHANTSEAKYSSDADISEMDEIKLRESRIQEVIVKVESKIQDMRTILDKLIHTKAQEKRDKLDKEMKDKNDEILQLTNKTLDLKAKIKLKEKTVELKDTSNRNKNKADNPNRETKGKPSMTDLNKDKTKEAESNEMIKTKPDVKDKDRPSTTKSLADDSDRRPKSSFCKSKRQRSAKGQGKESERKSRSYTGSTDS